MKKSSIFFILVVFGIVTIVLGNFVCFASQQEAKEIIKQYTDNNNSLPKDVNLEEWKKILDAAYLEFGQAEQQSRLFGAETQMSREYKKLQEQCNMILKDIAAQKDKPSDGNKDELKNYNFEQIRTYLVTYGQSGVKGLSSEIKDNWKKKVQEATGQTVEHKAYLTALLDGKTNQQALDEKEKVQNNEGPGQSDDSGWTPSDSNGSSMVDPIENPNQYRPGEAIGNDKIKTMGERILGIVNVVGVVVSMATMIIIGIRYMFGSVEEKSQMKETMIPYLVGAVLVFAIPTIVNIIYQFSQSLNNV